MLTLNTRMVTKPIIFINLKYQDKYFIQDFKFNKVKKKKNKSFAVYIWKVVLFIAQHTKG